jgi:Transcriptional antiterminator
MVLLGGEIMEIKRIYNNNVVLATKEDGSDVVLIGKGLAYGSSKGDKVAEEKIDKTFELKKENRQKFISVVQDLPYDYVILSEEVINAIRSRSSKKINDGIYITLTEHITNLMEKMEMGIVFDSTLLLNVKLLYREEYELGVLSVNMIQERLNIKIDESEASFIALHIINAEMDANMPTIYMILSVLENILRIVREYFCIDEKENATNRFITHCRFFAQRVINKEYQESKSSDSNKKIYDLLIRSNEKQNECIEAISKYIYDRYIYEMETDEKLYLLVHLIRLTSNS